MREDCPYILGIWDGHDSGAALLRGGDILFAANEERYTLRKLEVRFPERSIEAALAYCRVLPSEIRHIAVSTSDIAKTLARAFPYSREVYYSIRRRAYLPTRMNLIAKDMKYRMTEWGSNPFTRFASARLVRASLDRLGFSDYRLHLVDHHRAHAAAAAFTSSFDPCLVLTLDGVGDGLSGSVSVFREDTLERIAAIPSRHSFGIFFEHVTNLMNMRELEDEGKVMALADYAPPVPDSENPLLAFFSVDRMEVKARYGTLRMRSELWKVLWRYPMEQFARMAQRTLEVKAAELVRNAAGETGLNSVALSGGVASNVKMNMALRHLPEVERIFVFPHMGDGGLALGAAMDLNREVSGVSSYTLDDLFLGPAYNAEQMEKALAGARLNFRRSADIALDAAQRIAQGAIVLWFQGRMEVGPRALGARSVLALPDSEKLKNELNLRLKRRAWYQPFCPTMLEEDAGSLLEDYGGRPDRFMTMAYKVRESALPLVRGVINIDGTCRPQMIERGGSAFQKLLSHLKGLRGTSAVLNTSFNVHGEPIVNTPEEAVSVFRETGADCLAIGDYLAERDGRLS